MKKVKMEILAKSDKGKVREQNEDYFYVSDANRNPGIYMLADGMGRIPRRRSCK